MVARGSWYLDGTHRALNPASSRSMVTISPPFFPLFLSLSLSYSTLPSITSHESYFSPTLETTTAAPLDQPSFFHFFSKTYFLTLPYWSMYRQDLISFYFLSKILILGKKFLKYFYFILISLYLMNYGRYIHILINIISSEDFSTFIL